MSPFHAKAMLEALQQTIRTYEEKFGEIDITKIQQLAKVNKPTA